MKGGVDIILMTNLMPDEKKTELKGCVGKHLKPVS